MQAISNSLIFIHLLLSIQIFLGFAVIQIPEMALYWYGYVKKLWLNHRGSEPNSTAEIEPDKMNGNNTSTIQNYNFQSEKSSLNKGSQLTQHRTMQKPDPAIETLNERWIERWNLMNERMDNVEAKLQQIAFMREKATNAY